MGPQIDRGWSTMRSASLLLPWDDLESQTGEEQELKPEGYKDGILTGYWRLCDDEQKKSFVDCSGCHKVYVDVNVHEIKKLNDQEETFEVVMMMKFWWLDKDLRPAAKVMRKDGKEESGTILELAKNGDLKLKSDINDQVKTFKRGDYVDKTILEDMEGRFFPHYTFINIQGEPTTIIPGRYKFEWSDSSGTFVCWETKIDATFSESLELRDFPLDRQLCRIKISAEKNVEDFQFVMIKRRPGGTKVDNDSFRVDTEMQMICSSYSRYNDYHLPFHNQRSMINVIFHLDRVGDYFFNNILMMVFLVNVMGLCTFAIPLDDASGRLGLVSSCFLAVLAYRYIINEILPRKAYLTAADKYITFACVFLILICVETVVGTIWHSRIKRMDEMSDLEDESGDDGSMLSARMKRKRRIQHQDHLDYFDMVAGCVLSVAWVACNIFLWCQWKWSRRQPWHSVYSDNQEPYAPVEECAACGMRWLAKQSTHSDPHKRQCCPDSACGAQAHQVGLHYGTPKTMPSRPVPPQPLPEGPLQIVAKKQQ